MIKIDEKEVDKIRLSLLNLGHSWAESNRMSVDIYIKEGARKERMMRKAIQDLERLPCNTAQRAVRLRPTQTAWRNAHANI